MTQEDFTKKVNMLSPAYRQRLQNEEQEFFNSTIPVITISDQMPKYRQFVMMHVSELKNNISTKYWEYLLRGKSDSLCITDIVTILKAQEQLTFKDWVSTWASPNNSLNEGLKEWITMRDYFAKLTEEINPIIEDFSHNLLDKLLRTQHLDVSGQSHSIPKEHTIRDNPLVNAKR